MGPMQYSLTTATLFKSQKILFNARALSSNLIHRMLSTSQLPIFKTCPPQLHDLLHFSPVLPPLMGSPPPSFARFCDTHLFLVSIVENLILSGYRTELTIVVLDLVMPLNYVL